MVFPGYDFSENGGLNIGQHLAIAVCVLSCLLPLFAYQKMGGGDVKLIASLAVWMGPVFVFDFIILVSLIGGLLAGAYLCVRRLLQMQFVFAKFWVDPEVTKTGFQGGIPYGMAISAAGIYFIYNQYVMGAM
jgi:prepilin peptidase CpaA